MPISAGLTPRLSSAPPPATPPRSALPNSSAPGLSAQSPPSFDDSVSTSYAADVPGERGSRGDVRAYGSGAWQRDLREHGVDEGREQLVERRDALGHRREVVVDVAEVAADLRRHERGVALGEPAHRRHERADGAAQLARDMRRREADAEPAALRRLAAAEGGDAVAEGSIGRDRQVEAIAEPVRVDAEQVAVQVNDRAARRAGHQRRGVLHRSGHATAAGASLRGDEPAALAAAAEFRLERTDLQAEQVGRLAEQLPLAQIRLPFVFTTEIGPAELEGLAGRFLTEVEALGEVV